MNAMSASAAPWKAVVSIGVIFAALGIVFWWRAAGETPAASAQDIVQTACDSLELAKYYDVEAWASEYVDNPSDAFTSYLTMRVAEKDFHLVYSDQAGDGVLEFIRVDDQVYQRESQYQPEWKLSNRKFDDPLSHLSAFGNPICPDVSKFRGVGKESLEGSEVNRYSEKPPAGINVTIEDFDEKYHLRVGFKDLLVDKDGQLLKVETDSFRRGIASDGTPFLITVRLESTISGIGEVNVIEAPPVGTEDKQDG